mmetsp:Transcript_27312/g.46374  ORF Transcript_27312/g.46374 Transcript_27312/m.46374 type:complete len:164 (+) Transcript_27312:44-535(+)
MSSTSTHATQSAAVNTQPCPCMVLTGCTGGYTMLSGECVRSPTKVDRTSRCIPQAPLRCLVTFHTRRSRMGSARSKTMLEVGDKPPDHCSNLRMETQEAADITLFASPGTPAATDIFNRCGTSAGRGDALGSTRGLQSSHFKALNFGICFKRLCAGNQPCLFG